MNIKWIIEFNNRELNIIAIDARFSKLGFYGLENLKATKNLKYLNASYTRYFDDHWWVIQFSEFNLETRDWCILTPSTGKLIYVSDNMFDQYDASAQSERDAGIPRPGGQFHHRQGPRLFATNDELEVD